jgi:putative phage-type endonuclease
MSNIETVAITDEQKWLETRLKDVTSTEASALYELNPYQTVFELFHAKKNQEVIRIEENERMSWGKRLERSIAEGAAESMGWDVEPLNVYMRNPETRMGSSFDYKINNHDDGPGILEVKNVDGIVYKSKWIDDGAGNIEAPEHIELQVQHQMEVADIDWCAIVALVGGNTQKIVYRKRDREIGADLKKRVADFWHSIAADRAPSPDYHQDAEFIIKQLRATATPGLIAEADEELDELIRSYAFVQQEANDLAKMKDAYKAQILDRVGEASKILSSIGSISCGVTSPSAGTLITPDMVGTTIGGRKGFRNFRLTKKKGN